MARRTDISIVWGSSSHMRVTCNDRAHTVRDILNPCDTSVGAPVVIRYESRSRRRACYVVPVEIVHQALEFVRDMAE
jgi:hypothetical protein